MWNRYQRKVFKGSAKYKWIKRSTHNRANAGSCKGEGKTGHGDRPEVQDLWIHIQRRQSLKIHK